MHWVEKLTGLADDSPASIHRHLSVQNGWLISAVNGRQMWLGTLDLPNLTDLRGKSMTLPKGTTLRNRVADVQDLLCDPAHAGATFQVASQTNLLEMVGPTIGPEDGIARYEHDRTQGPACAIACGAATLFRNYFIQIDAALGQSANTQLDCLSDLGRALGNPTEGHWHSRNGYVLPGRDTFRALRRKLEAMTPKDIDHLRGLVRIGLQRDTEVTAAPGAHRVNQVFCSALPLAYASLPDSDWQFFARLILEASYEACFQAARRIAAETGDNRLFLTLLGGGAFGNPDHWISDAIVRALTIGAAEGLALTLVSYGSPWPGFAALRAQVEANNLRFPD